VRETLPEGDVDAAYRVQQTNTDRWIEAGRRIVGRKIGLTAKAVQRQLGVDQPDYGMLFADMCVVDGDEIAAGSVLQPRCEAEVALVLHSALDREQLTLIDVIDAVAYALPAIEVVGSRIAGWNHQHRRYRGGQRVVGAVRPRHAPVMLDDLDLRECGMVMENRATRSPSAPGWPVSATP